MTERIDILVSARNQASPVAQQVATDFRAMGQAVQGVGSSGTGAIDALTGSLGGLGGVLAGGVITAGIGAIISGFGEMISTIDELSRRGAIFEQLGSVLGDYAASVGQAGDAFVEAGRKASAGTIADFDLILNANRAIQFEVAKTSDQYAKLIELSTALGRAQGISDTEALGFLTTGIARESRLILDNLGLIIDLEAVTSSYAATLGKTADDLTTTERKQAILNEAYRQGQVALEANRDAIDSAATRFERMDASIQNAKDALGALFAPAVSVVAENIAKAAASAAESLIEVGKGVDVSDAIGQMEGLRRVIAGMDEGIARLKSDQGGPFEDNAQLFDLQADRQKAQEQLNRLTDEYFNALRRLHPEQEKVLNPTSVEAQAAAYRDLAIARAEAANAGKADIAAAPDFVGQAANRLIRTGDDDAGIRSQVASLKGDFEDIQKLQDAIGKGINSNALKLSDVLGPEQAFRIARQQLSDLDKQLQSLSEKKLTGEISTEEFLFQLQALPSQTQAIFAQVQQAAKDGGEKLQEDIAGLFDLRAAFETGGNTEGVIAVTERINQLTGILAIINPAAATAAQGLDQIGAAASRTDSMLAAIVTNAGGAGTALEGLGSSTANADAMLASVVTNAGGAGVAMGQLGADASTAAFSVDDLVGALAAAPPALAAAGSAMIAAGVDASTAAGLVAGLTAEFNQLAGAQAGARRAIIQRAAGVADIVGPAKALALANQEIAKSEAAYEGLADGLLAAGDGSLQFEFDLALLGSTTTTTFDEIEEADRKAKQLAREGLSQASKAASDTGRSFEDLKGKVAGVLSGALSLDVGVDTEAILGREDAINEDARRLADVAVNGFASPWAQYLKDKFPDTIGAAFDGADPKKAAAQLLRDFEDGLRPELLDKDKAKERVRRALVGEENMAQLAAEIAAELSAEFGGSINLGRIQAVAGTTLGVDGAETDQLKATLTSAASGIQQQLSGLGGSLKSGIISALEGIGEAVTGALDKQFRSEGNLKTIRSAGATNGEAWGSGFLDTVGENVPPKLVEILASLVTPSVEALLNRNATLQGAN
jgi:hypothetical protein